VLNGRWGPYISYKKKNYKIPKDTEAADLSYDDCLKLIAEGDKTKKTKKGKTSKTSGTKKTTKSASAGKKKGSSTSKTTKKAK